MGVPYHYYENQTFDKSAKDPWRPWTYSYHNFELEHSKYKQLEKACWLTVRVLTPILPRSPIGDRSAPRARDSRHKVVCTRPQAQIVGLGLDFSSRP
eukprot:scaffold118681_cov46-Phaeocystis_antarctica.AAC.1